MSVISLHHHLSFIAGRWSRGSNRLQMDADSKLLSEFLSFIQTDTARLAHDVSSLGQVQATSMNQSTCTFFFPTCYLNDRTLLSICFARQKSQRPPQASGGERTLQTLRVGKSCERPKTWDRLFNKLRKVDYGCMPFLTVLCCGITKLVTGGLEECYTSSLGD
jgi:hypothetical protein